MVRSLLVLSLAEVRGGHLLAPQDRAAGTLRWVLVIVEVAQGLFEGRS